MTNTKNSQGLETGFQPRFVWLGVWALIAMPQEATRHSAEFISLFPFISSVSISHRLPSGISTSLCLELTDSITHRSIAFLGAARWQQKMCFCVPSLGFVTSPGNHHHMSHTLSHKWPYTVLNNSLSADKGKVDQAHLEGKKSSHITEEKSKGIRMESRTQVLNKARTWLARGMGLKLSCLLNAVYLMSWAHSSLGRSSVAGVKNITMDLWWKAHRRGDTELRIKRCRSHQWNSTSFWCDMGHVT